MTASSAAAIVPHNKDDDGSCGKYRSPLDHMQNNNGFGAGQRFVHSGFNVRVTRVTTATIDIRRSRTDRATSTVKHIGV